MDTRETYIDNSIQQAASAIVKLYASKDVNDEVVQVVVRRAIVEGLIANIRKQQRGQPGSLTQLFVDTIVYMITLASTIDSANSSNNPRVREDASDEFLDTMRDVVDRIRLVVRDKHRLTGKEDTNAT